jgi:hypothetical protein
LSKIVVTNKLIKLDDFRGVMWATTQAVCHKCETSITVSYPVNVDVILCDTCGQELVTDRQKFFELINEAHASMISALQLLGENPHSYNAAARMAESCFWANRAIDSSLTQGPPKGD